MYLHLKRIHEAFMRKIIYTAGLIIIILAFSLPGQAENFPAQSTVPQKTVKATIPADQNFYGYVPPAPIRHTWPGGYRVIFHELTNTLMEHLLGQY